MNSGDLVYTIKIIANDPENNIYIVATAAIDIGSGKCISQDIAATNNPALWNLQVKATHKDFLGKIQNAIYTGKQLKNITKALQEQFRKSHSNDSFVEELIHYVETRDYSKLGYLYEQLFIRSCGTGKYMVQVAAEKILKSDLDKPSLDTRGQGTFSAPETDLGQSPLESSPSEVVPSDIPMGAKLLQFKFLLSPVSGTPVRDLAPGSTILIRLNPQDPYTLDTILNLNLKNEDGSVKPITATVYKINHKGNESEVIVKISDTLFAKNLEEENSVKIKTTLTDIKSRIQEITLPPDHNKNLEALKNDNTLFYYILGIAGVVAFGILILVFLL